MLKKIKTNIFPTQVQKHLDRTNINKSHSLINHINLNLLIRLINNPKQNKQLVQYLTRGIHSTTNTFKIKCYIVIHACLRYCNSQELVNIIVNQQVKIMESKDNDKQVDFNVYVHNNIVNYYLIYLKKICMNRQSYQYIKKYTNFKQVPSKYNNYNNNKNISLPNMNSYNLNNNNINNDNILQHEQNLAIVTHGFKILNLSNYLLQSQQLFNKMGRYHIQCQQFISLFVQILQDLNLFNKYIKLSIQTIILTNNNNNKKFVDNCLQFVMIDRLSDYKRMENNESKQGNKICYNFKKDKNMTSSTQMQSSQIIPQQTLKNITDNQKQNQGQQLKHQFLYINQSQKVSDRLYQYYHNRYYYKILKNIVEFPTFLTVQSRQYTRLKNKTKKVDKNLVRLIKKSKYDGENTVCYQTQQNNSANIQDQINLEKGNYTESCYVKGQFGSTRYNAIIQKGVENLDQY